MTSARKVLKLLSGVDWVGNLQCIACCNMLTIETLDLGFRMLVIKNSVSSSLPAKRGRVAISSDDVSLFTLVDSCQLGREAFRLSWGSSWTHGGWSATLIIILFLIVITDGSSLCQSLEKVKKQVLILLQKKDLLTTIVGNSWRTDVDQKSERW